MAMFSEQVNAFRRSLLAHTLNSTGGNVSQTARLLGLHRTYVCRLIREYGLSDLRRGRHAPNAQGGRP